MSLSCLARFEVGEVGGTESETSVGCPESEPSCAETSGESGGDASGGCVEGEISCGGTCVDASSDEDHCGSCGVECVANEMCQGGQCVDECAGACDPHLELCEGGECQCRDELADCSGVCVDLDSDPANCGQCGNLCDMGACEDGECRQEGCESNESFDCEGACVDLDEDPLHCGACRTACTVDELCVSGECVGFSDSGCRSDEDCSGGVCCSLEDSESVCVDGDQCP